jgi:hypothetical protein
VSPVDAAADEGAPMAVSEKDEISQLWVEITGWRKEGGLQPEPDSRLWPRVEPLSVGTIRQPMSTGDEPSSSVCIDTCSISNNICNNAERICQIADSLGGDDWADDKCTSAKAACQQATEQCTSCIESEKTGGEKEAKIEAPVWN